MTVIVTRNVADRFRGFLASCMLEIVPGVYTSARMSKAVRTRVWRVLSEWFEELEGSSITMIWTDRKAASGQGVEILGAPPVDIIDADGVLLTFRRGRGS